MAETKIPARRIVIILVQDETVLGNELVYRLGDFSEPGFLFFEVEVQIAIRHSADPC